jgi:hypothetical protein
VKVLLVASWVNDLSELRAAVRAMRPHTTIARVDFEPALAAALGREQYDLVVYMPTPGLALDVVCSLAAATVPAPEVVVVAKLDDVARALDDHALRNHN